MAVPVSVAAVLVFDLSWLAFFPLLVGGLIALGYSAVLHYLALELAMRPILFDINAALDSPVRIERPGHPAALQAARLAAADQRDHRRHRRRADPDGGGVRRSASTC